MLVLTRKVGAQVVIGESIHITVVAIKGNQVRLGFQAPDDVPIRRQEICFDTTSVTDKSENDFMSVP